nr:MAG TPA: hypothetical protein [Caudoviricetes sp.]
MRKHGSLLYMWTGDNPLILAFRRKAGKGKE